MIYRRGFNSAIALNSHQIFCQLPAALQSWRSPLFVASARMSILGDHAISSTAVSTCRSSSCFNRGSAAASEVSIAAESEVEPGNSKFGPFEAKQSQGTKTKSTSLSKFRTLCREGSLVYILWGQVSAGKIRTDHPLVSEVRRKMLLRQFV